MKTNGRVEVKIHAFLTKALDGGPGHFNPGVSSSGIDLACGWHHNSRKLIAILLVIENAFDYELDCITWTAIQNWNARWLFSARRSQDFHRDRYEPSVTFAHAPSSLPIVKPQDRRLDSSHSRSGCIRWKNPTPDGNWIPVVEPLLVVMQFVSRPDVLD
jgi:hypothetical protein